MTDRPTVSPTDSSNLDDLLDRALESAYEAPPRSAGEETDDGADSGSDPSPRQAPSMPDTIGRYEVLGLLGTGGMGDVYKARDPELGRALAIKMLPEHLTDQGELLTRFLEEARLSSQLNHPGVVPIHEVGHSEDGRPFFTMKVVEGQTLDHMLREREQPISDQRRFLEIFEKVCQTLAFAHEHGVLHRDLKSSNIMIGAFGEVRVMDWGLARRIDAPRDTDKPDIAGTPANMAPEQARGQKVGAPADVFSLGGVLCEILTGAPPYTGASRSEQFLRASKGWLDDTHERLSTCGAEPGLIALVSECLDLEPARRPADAGALSARVREQLEQIDRRVHLLEIETAEARAKAREAQRARRLTLALAVAVVVVLVLGGGGWLWRELEQQTRQRSDEQTVSNALQEAELLARQARRDGTANPAPWEQALVAANATVEFARTREIGSGLRQRIDVLVDEVAKGKERAQRDQKMRVWLQEIRPHMSDDRGLAELDGAYRAAFASYGLDLEREEAADPEFAAILKESAIRRDLASGLDDWAFILWRNGKIVWQRLMHIAIEATTDPRRRQLRKALRKGDTTALQRLAQGEDLAELPAETLDLLGKCLLVFRKFEDSTRVYRIAWLHHPGDFNINHNLANALIRSGNTDWHEVLRLYSMAAALRPHSAHALADMGRVLMDIKEYGRSRLVLERASVVDPDYPRTWLYLGVVENRLGTAEKASKCFETALRLDPKNYEALRNLAILHMSAGKSRAAADLLGRAAKIVPNDAGILEMLGSAQIKSGRIAPAVATLRRVASLAPTNPRVLYNLGRAYWLLGRTSDAISSFEKATKKNPTMAEAYCNLGMALADAGRFDEAVTAAAKGHALGSRRSDWRHPSGLWLEVAEQLKLAAKRLPAVLEQGPEGLSADDAALLASVAARQGDHKTACDLYATAFGRDPKLADGRFPRHRFWAACAAVQLAFGTEGLAAAERARWREQGLAWLEAELSFASEHGADDSARLQHLHPWRHVPALAPVRAERCPAAVTPEEWGRWRGLWRGLDQLIEGLQR